MILYNNNPFNKALIDMIAEKNKCFGKKKIDILEVKDKPLCEKFIEMIIDKDKKLGKRIIDMITEKDKLFLGKIIIDMNAEKEKRSNKWKNYMNNHFYYLYNSNLRIKYSYISHSDPNLNKILNFVDSKNEDFKKYYVESPITENIDYNFDIYFY